ncbi:hypothetical protein PC129_g12628 [Phytophthora cactorum]|uniref:Uncharacterized protein n=1 Tax=Phytophthora cactorum TaxID=29920 RepID=A0A8T0YM95_9STRA|nr:hypothetical protein PC112_g14384 [Phytophthora cactorum]KAG2817825.1 hypothetical protein PC111_g12553 [Phytophthora cactorum]KAG2852945.1 hypothetical protein PC113_g14583 [Phytophthora cactorum]KAG2894880.1 hypothetical protein PC114_g15703 [Phytophthora cactorum]KAG2907737.1 hypothetical protein PC115_g13784 [Phytophthora cactorum]
MTGHATTIGRPDEASSDPYPVQDGDTIAGPSPTMPHDEECAASRPAFCPPAGCVERRKSTALVVAVRG